MQELLINDSPLAVNSVVDAGKRLWVINKREEEIKIIKEDKKSYIASFNEMIRKAEDQVSFIRGAVESYMENTDRKTLRLPEGTVSLTKTLKHEFPDESILIAYSKANSIPLTEKITVKPDLAAIKAHIKNGGTPPMGYQTHHAQGLTIRHTKQAQNELPEHEQEALPNNVFLSLG